MESLHQKQSKTRVMLACFSNEWIIHSLIVCRRLETPLTAGKDLRMTLCPWRSTARYTGLRE